jgi:hypothetical protein
MPRPCLPGAANHCCRNVKLRRQFANCTAKNSIGKGKAAKYITQRQMISDVIMGRNAVIKRTRFIQVFNRSGWYPRADLNEPTTKALILYRRHGPQAPATERDERSCPHASRL